MWSHRVPPNPISPHTSALESSVPLLPATATSTLPRRGTGHHRPCPTLTPPSAFLCLVPFALGFGRCGPCAFRWVMLGDGLSVECECGASNT
eukprot:scaffold107777_cov37-Tisochrysis_lutea.AAC.4